MEDAVLLPVVTQTWKVHDAHQYHKPKYASSSSTVSCVHSTNFSPPMHSRAYWLVCTTIYSSSDVVKKRWNIPNRESGRGCRGPAVPLNFFTWTDVSVAFHFIVSKLSIMCKVDY